MRSDPLCEKGLRNFDFLLFKRHAKTSVAIFGEVKSSVTNPSRIIDDFEKKRETVELNREFIATNYLGVKQRI